MHAKFQKKTMWLHHVVHISDIRQPHLILQEPQFWQIKSSSGCNGNDHFSYTDISYTTNTTAKKSKISTVTIPKKTSQ